MVLLMLVFLVTISERIEAVSTNDPVSNLIYTEELLLDVSIGLNLTD